MEQVSLNRCFGGTQAVYSHQSSETKTPMRFSVFTPDHEAGQKLPVLWYLSGLTCTEENFTVKAGAQRYAAEHGIIVIAPDTSPRGANIEGEDDSYDFGSGAGFYVDASQSPWDLHYRMYSYITRELPALVFNELDADAGRQGITGHSMGGHGALTIALKNPEVYQSVSAFSPICSPTQCPWGHKALGGYLGQDQQSWLEYDTVELIQSGKKITGTILVDQGKADDFLDEQLKPELLQRACAENGQDLNLRIHNGYDHSYYFIATFMGDHIAHHASVLNG